MAETTQETEQTIGQQLALLKAVVKRPLVVFPIYIDIAGGILPGLLLSQLIYWTTKNEEKEGEDFGQMAWSEKSGWFFVRLPKLQESLRMGKHEMESARKRLQERGFVECVVKGVPPTLWVRVDMIKVLQAVKVQLSGNREINYPETGKSIDRKPDGQLPENREIDLPESGESTIGKPENHHPETGKSYKEEETYSSQTKRQEKKRSASVNGKPLSTVDGIHYSKWRQEYNLLEKDWVRRNVGIQQIPDADWIEMAEIAAERAGAPKEVIRRILKHELPGNRNVDQIGRQQELAL
ncbi:MAG TPA: hypothetical protein VKY85_01330 [Candidatus Angelobacter sp.]|nr:hypothetical protein [Candidatus Angelobacter sp.]